MSENLRRAQLLADQAFDILMWNENGDGTTYTERPITERQRIRVESLTALSLSYSQLGRHEGPQVVEIVGANDGTKGE